MFVSKLFFFYVYIDIIKKMYYQPAVDRGRPAVLEMALNLPAQSKVKFTVSFDKVFLKYTEHHPDANRGFDVGYAVVTVSLPRHQGQIGYGGVDHLRIFQQRNSGLVQDDSSEPQKQEQSQNETDKIRVYTETLLVSLPTPDFSMPYNVITLTCTVIALFFGSIFNLIMRNFEVAEVEKQDKGKSKQE
jgi:phosphatidylinositol glycan class T